MKTIKSVLVVAAFSATLLSLNAAEPLLSPRGTGVRHPVVATSVSKDSNLLAEWPKGGARSSAATAVVAAGVSDPDLLSSIGKCSMPPKTKGTPDCEKMCKAAGIK
jgi:hypothetical protein